MYPPAIMIPRKAGEDVEIDGCIVPEGTQFLIFAYAIHHNPDVWENPSKFDPDRFTKDKCDARSPYAYLPFSAGPRNCIGQKYGYLELKVVLSHFFRNFRVVSHDAPEDIPLVMLFVLHPENPLNITVTPR